MEILEYLNNKGLHFSKKGEQYNLNCPFCGDRENKFYISKAGLFKCFHENNCGKQGNFYQFQVEMGDKPKPIIKDNIFNHKKKSYKKPEKLNNSADVNDRFLQYFKSRKIEPKILEKYNIKITDNKWIMFPYFKKGELVNRKYRTIDKKFKQEKEAEPCLFGQDHISASTMDIVICEGEIDCLTWDQLGYSAVSIPGGVNNMDWIENDYEFLKQFKTIYISMDMDKAGRDAVQKISVRLGKWRCYDLKLPEKDINECIKAGYMDDEISEWFDQAEGFNIPCLKTADEFTDDVIELIENPDALNGYDIGYSGLGKILKGWREGELTIWTGKNGSGKSTFINQALVKMIFKHAHNICIGSFELPPKRFLNWIVKSEPRVMDVNPENRAKAVTAYLDALGEKLYIIDIVGSVDKTYLSEIMEFGAKKYGIKHFLIDSMMRIDLPSYNELLQQKTFISELKAFAMNNLVHVHLITHPRKTQRDDDVIGAMDVSGSGNITDLADNVIVVHRFSEKQKQTFYAEGEYIDAKLLVTKCREHGDTGTVFLRFDKNYKKFYEVVKGEE